MKIIIIGVVLFVLFIISSYFWENSGDPADNIYLSNQTIVNSFCASHENYESSGTTAVLDTFKNSGNCVGNYPNIACTQTWFEWQGGNPEQVFCYGNNTGTFYKRSFRKYTKEMI